MRRRGKLPPFSAGLSASLSSLAARALTLLRLLLLVLLLITTSSTSSTVAATTMRRQVAAFVQVPARASFFYSHRPAPPPPSTLQLPSSRPPRRAFCSATPTTGSAPTTTPSPKPAAAMKQLKESLQELQQIADYFPGTIKDNSTAFFHAPQAYATVPEALTAALHISPERAQKLHEIGAVYIYRQMKFRRSRLIEDFPPVSVEEGDLLRVYLFPRRFPECVTDYSSRVVWEDEEVMIVDKPPGCPCSLHVSNALEALDVAASASLGVPLIRMNRLDIVTTGLVPLAKTAQGATRFWEEIRRDRVGKKYKALLTGPVPVGILEHYMPGKIIHRRPAPRAISRQALEGWKVCQTRVLSCTPVPSSELDVAALLDARDHNHNEGEEEKEEAREGYTSISANEESSISSSSSTSSSSSSPFSLSSPLYEVEAELITGRTHQLRAVFAAEGSPIWQDTMYSPLTSFLLDDEDDPAIQSIYPLCVEPKARTGIALQCAGLTFWGQTVEAGQPWWRRKLEEIEEEEGREGMQVKEAPTVL